MEPDSKQVSDELIMILRSRLGERASELLMPPPVFDEMGGEFIEFSQEEGWLRTRFPVKPQYLNPYRTMQGGMIAAAVDNTLGPLSMLVASPNVTRKLEMKYSQPVYSNLKHLYVLGRLLIREGRTLHFTAEVRKEDGTLLARARATHWITEPE